MSIIVAMLVGAAPIGAVIDRASLDLQAQAEALRPATTASRRQGPQVRLQDLGTIASICEAASRQSDPGEFLRVLERAYGMSQAESSALRSSCTGYLAARASSGRPNLNR